MTPGRCAHWWYHWLSRCIAICKYVTVTVYLVCLFVWVCVCLPACICLSASLSVCLSDSVMFWNAGIMVAFSHFSPVNMWLIQCLRWEMGLFQDKTIMVAWLCDWIQHIIWLEILKLVTLTVDYIQCSCGISSLVHNLYIHFKFLRCPAKYLSTRSIGLQLQRITGWTFDPVAIGWWRCIEWCKRGRR